MRKPSEDFTSVYPNGLDSTHGGQGDELFAERFSKFSVRDFQNNTRMNINNVNYAAAWEKRDRAIRYW